MANALRVDAPARQPARRWPFHRAGRIAGHARFLATLCLVIAGGATAQIADLPRSLHETGLYAADNTLHPAALAFSPQYPLWSDGADKQRWIRLPAGTAIDASNPDVWAFPAGTKLWKTFSYAGRPVETRYLERLTDGRWRFATYIWNGDSAALAPERGIPGLPVAEAPGGRYAIPSRGDCLACHGGAAAPVLGFSALQLSPARDPNAPHARDKTDHEHDLRDLVKRGLVRGLPPSAATPGIAAATPIERAALGYLHGNCAHCHHNAGGQVPVRLNLMQRAADATGSTADVLRSMIGAASRYQAGDDASRVVIPGNAAASVLIERMRTRDMRVQMPPLGTNHPDTEALTLLTRWINQDLTQRKEKQP